MKHCCWGVSLNRFLSYNIDMDIKKKHSRRKARNTTVSSYVALGMLIVAIVFLGNATWNVYRTHAEARIRELRAKEELAALVLREETLREDIARLNTEEGREAEMRERFGVGRAGEKLIVITEVNIGDNEETRPIVPCYGELWQLIFGTQR